jgi:hypothetical protein
MSVLIADAESVVELVDIYGISKCVGYASVTLRTRD